MDARVGLSNCIEKMRMNQMWRKELECIWGRLRDIHETKLALAQMLNLNDQRREAFASAGQLLDQPKKLDDEFTLRLQHLSKIANKILAARSTGQLQEDAPLKTELSAIDCEDCGNGSTTGVSTPGFPSPYLYGSRPRVASTQWVRAGSPPTSRAQ